MGSVKDLTVIVPPTEQSLGSGIFDFSDRYSIFDWGEMPDHIPNKGSALLLMAAWNFEELQRQGVQTHYIGIRNSENKSTTIRKLKEPTTKIEVSLSRVIEPIFKDGEYDYSYFINGRDVINNFIVPLEVIYRNGAPKGSSLFKTINEMERLGETEKLKSFFSKYGLTDTPQPGQVFTKTGYDFTTKFEPSDRRVSDETAYTISGLLPEQFKELQEVRNTAVKVVRKRSSQVGLIDFDGKHEYRLFDGQVSIADVFGTLDENRFMIQLHGKQVQVSKEFLRQYHKKHQKDWYEETERAKQEAKQKSVEDWTSLSRIKPQPLPPALVSLVGEMYASASDRYTSSGLFKKARALEQVMEDLMLYME